MTREELEWAVESGTDLYHIIIDRDIGQRTVHARCARLNARKIFWRESAVYYYAYDGADTPQVLDYEDIHPSIKLIMDESRKRGARDKE